MYTRQNKNKEDLQANKKLMIVTEGVSLDSSYLVITIFPRFQLLYKGIGPWFSTHFVFRRIVETINK